MARSPTGELHLCDVAIRHTCSPVARSFGVHATRVRQFERDKRAEYSRTAWSLQPEVPRVVPLLASTYGFIGEHAQRFFRRVVKSHAVASPVASDALRFQNLASGQSSELWRRRISVSLRIFIALQVLSRVRAATHGPGPVRGYRPARRMGWALGAQRRQLFGGIEERQGDVEARLAERGVGGAYGGDCARPGVLGDSFPRTHGPW